MANEQLTQIIELLPVIKQLFEQDVYLTVLDRKGTIQGYTKHLVEIKASIKDANNAANEHMENVSHIQKILDQTLVLAAKLEEDLGKQ